MSFKRLNQKRFHGEHDRDEGESISQDARNVEQLERDPDLEADAVGPAEDMEPHSPRRATVHDVTDLYTITKKTGQALQSPTYVKFTRRKPPATAPIRPVY